MEQPEPLAKVKLTRWGILSAGYNVCQSWLVIAATLSVSLVYGPMNTVWGLIAATIIYTCIGLTLAELVSAYPTTGGQYHWTFILAPAPINRILVSLVTEPGFCEKN
jgi:choline transport protein